jgi:hypothetical protein
MNGGDTLNAWGTAYGVAAFMDVVLCESTKMLVIYVLALIVAKPQLRSIRSVINDAALRIVQDEAGLDSVVEKFSVVQHLSPACRAANKKRLYDMPSAAVLRQLDDVDFAKCREHRFFYAGILLLVMVALPAILSMISEMVLDQLMDLILASFYGMLSLGATTLYDYSHVLLALLVSFVAAYLCYRIGLFDPAVESYHKIQAEQLHSNNQSIVSARQRMMANKKRKNSQRIHMRYLAKAKVIISRAWKAFIKNSSTIVPFLRKIAHKENASRVELIWRGLNDHPTLPIGTVGHHGRVEEALEDGDHHHKRLKVGGITLSPHELSAFELLKSLPEEVLKMRSAVIKMKKRLIALERAEESVDHHHMDFTHRVFAALDERDHKAAHAQSPTAHANEQRPVLRQNLLGRGGRDTRRYRVMKRVTTDIDTAMHRMLVLVATRDGQHIGDYVTATPDHVVTTDIFLTHSEIVEILTEIWTSFYPGNKPLSESESDYVLECLDGWWKQRIGADGDGFVSFDHFSGWFKGIYEQLSRRDGCLGRDESQDIGDHSDNDRADRRRSGRKTGSIFDFYGGTIAVGRDWLGITGWDSDSDSDNESPYSAPKVYSETNIVSEKQKPEKNQSSPNWLLGRLW